MSAIEEYNRNTVASAGKWSEKLKEARRQEKYANGIARITGIDPEIVKRSISAINWNNFAESSDQYIGNYINGVRNKGEKWLQGLINFIEEEKKQRLSS